MWHPPFKDLYPWRSDLKHPEWSDLWEPWQRLEWIGTDTTHHLSLLFVRLKHLQTNPGSFGQPPIRDIAEFFYSLVNLLLGRKLETINMSLPCHWVFIWGLVRRVAWHFVLGSKDDFLCWWWLETRKNTHVIVCRCFFVLAVQYIWCI